jgi:hypothetical protein
MTVVDDKAALIAQPRRWADLPSLKRILVSHGSTIEDDPRGVMRNLVASLESRSLIQPPRRRRCRPLIGRLGGALREWSGRQFGDETQTLARG